MVRYATETILNAILSRRRARDPTLQKPTRTRFQYRAAVREPEGFGMLHEVHYRYCYAA